MKLLWAMIATMILSGCGQNQTEYYFDDHPAGATYRAWAPESLPLVIQVPNELIDYRYSIENSARHWNDALGQTAVVFVYEGAPNTQWVDSKSSLYDNFFGLFRQVSWAFPDIGTSVLAYTGTLSLDGTIRHADLIFNFDNYTFADVENPPPTTNYVDFESVLTHELGHFLGLGHVTSSEDSQSVMLPSLRKAEARRELSSGDLVRIRNLYFRL